MVKGKKGCEGNGKCTSNRWVTWVVMSKGEAYSLPGQVVRGKDVVNVE